MCVCACVARAGVCLCMHKCMRLFVSNEVKAQYSQIKVKYYLLKALNKQSRFETKSSFHQTRKYILQSETRNAIESCVP